MLLTADGQNSGVKIRSYTLPCEIARQYLGGHRSNRYTRARRAAQDSTPDKSAIAAMDDLDVDASGEQQQSLPPLFTDVDIDLLQAPATYSTVI